MKTKRLNNDVEFADSDIRAFGQSEIMGVAERALHNPSGKFRICLHRDTDDTMHEMLVGLRRDLRYPSHRHPSGEESYMVLHGAARLRLFDSVGAVQSVVELSEPLAGASVFARIPSGVYHALEILSEVCVFLETKPGPFSPDNNEIAPFAKDDI